MRNLRNDRNHSLKCNIIFQQGNIRKCPQCVWSILWCLVAAAGLSSFTASSWHPRVSVKRYRVVWRSLIITAVIALNQQLRLPSNTVVCHTGAFLWLCALISCAYCTLQNSVQVKSTFYSEYNGTGFIADEAIWLLCCCSLSVCHDCCY